MADILYKCVNFICIRSEPSSSLRNERRKERMDPFIQSQKLVFLIRFNKVLVIWDLRIIFNILMFTD